MAINWIEDTTSRSATIFRLGRRDASVRSRVWNIVGSTNEDVIHGDINSRISNLYQDWTYPGQPLVRLRAESYSLEHDADDLWKVTINYEKIGADDPTQSGPLKRVRSQAQPRRSSPRPQLQAKLRASKSPAPNPYRPAQTSKPTSKPN
jgi:hypothetical protein